MTEKERDGTAYCGGQDEDGLTSDSPDDEPYDHEDDEDCGPHFGVTEADV